MGQGEQRGVPGDEGLRNLGHNCEVPGVTGAIHKLGIVGGY